MWVVGPFMRYFDYRSAQRVDVWIANSQEVAGRIRKFYRKEAMVVYPPVETSARAHVNTLTRENYYLIVSRVVGGKGIEEAVEAFEKLGIKLIIAGEKVGKLDHYTIKPLNKVKFVGRVSNEELADLYAGAKGFVALARDEDFGMTVVESMGYGTPVLAYNGGGYRETVRDPAHQQIGESASQHVSKSANQKLVQTGVLIDNLDTESIRKGIERMEKTKWDRKVIKQWASQFNRARFEKEIRSIVGE